MTGRARATAAAVAAAVALVSTSTAVAAAATTRDLRPGQSIYIVDRNSATMSACTLGWLVVSLTGEVEALTAGHCRTGEQVEVYNTPGGKLVEAGRWKQSVHTARQTALDGTDIGTVSLTSHLGHSARTVNGIAPAAVSTAESLRKDPPARICKMGGRTGLSCGPLVDISPDRVTFRAVVDHGDSGGPVWAESRSGAITAVAVVVGRSDQDPTITVGQLINPWLIESAATLGIPG